MQIELLMKCCHENVQGWSPIFFLLLKKIWWVWVYFAVEKMFPVTGTYRKEGFKFFLLNPRKISEEILLSSSCELQCSDHSKETTMRRFSLWALYGGTSDRQDVMNTVWVGSICSVKNWTSFYVSDAKRKLNCYLKNLNSISHPKKTCSKCVFPRNVATNWECVPFAV